MQLEQIQNKVPAEVYEVLKKRNIEELRPAQAKAINAGLFEGKNLLVCTPTSSGKTLIAELAALNLIFHNNGKAVYIVPLKALANEKFREMKKDFGHLIKIALSIGDADSSEPHLSKYDLIITTSEKFDSLIRHHAEWISQLKCVIVDEIHILNDVSRGPTIEIVITILKHFLKNPQIIGLSATIGNPKELAQWLDAELIVDDWRPVELKKGVYADGKIEFYE